MLQFRYTSSLFIKFVLSFFIPWFFNAFQNKAFFNLVEYRNLLSFLTSVHAQRMDFRRFDMTTATAILPKRLSPFLTFILFLLLFIITHNGIRHFLQIFQCRKLCMQRSVVLQSVESQNILISLERMNLLPVGLMKDSIVSGDKENIKS